MERARAKNVQGTLNIKLDAWEGAPWWMTNVRNPPGTDRYLIGNTESGEVVGSYTGSDLPLIPAAVALGIHLHQGDFGPVNRWLNTALAVALIWLSATGLLSWWRRRPKGRLGIPPDVSLRWPRVVVWSLAAMSVLLPLFGLSVLAIAGLDRVIRFATAQKGALP